MKTVLENATKMSVGTTGTFCGFKAMVKSTRNSGLAGSFYLRRPRYKDYSKLTAPCRVVAVKVLRIKASPEWPRVLYYVSTELHSSHVVRFPDLVDLWVITIK